MNVGQNTIPRIAAMMVLLAVTGREAAVACSEAFVCSMLDSILRLKSCVQKYNSKTPSNGIAHHLCVLNRSEKDSKEKKT